jgi:nitroimidazol reductase NimA-like FMN-containing flavoprotein (pyridoxamine 5'-phosphate oxidase superfamily)
VTAPSSDRVRVRRGARKGRYDSKSVRSVLDAGLVAHVAFVADGQPYCLPMLYARVEEQVLIHGSRASRLMRALATGAPACLTVTILRGLVLARSVFEHSANYESVSALGRFTLVEDDTVKRAALEAFTEKLVPGRWREVRQPSAKELRATSVLAMPLAEAAVKLRTGPPDDDRTRDAALEVWAGTIPIETNLGTPEPSPGLRPGTALSPSVAALRAGLRPAQQGPDSTIPWVDGDKRAAGPLDAADGSSTGQS